MFFSIAAMQKCMETRAVGPMRHKSGEKKNLRHLSLSKQDQRQTQPVTSAQLLSIIYNLPHQTRSQSHALKSSAWCTVSHYFWTWGLGGPKTKVQMREKEKRVREHSSGVWLDYPTSPERDLLQKYGTNHKSKQHLTQSIDNTTSINKTPSNKILDVGAWQHKQIRNVL